MTVALFSGVLTPSAGGSPSSGGGSSSSPDYSAYRTGVNAADPVDASTPTTGAARAVTGTQGKTYAQLRFADPGGFATILVAFYTSAAGGLVEGRQYDVQATVATAGGKYVAEPVEVPTLAPYADVRVLNYGGSVLDVYLWGL